MAGLYRRYKGHIKAQVEYGNRSSKGLCQWKYPLCLKEWKLVYLLCQLLLSFTTAIWPSVYYVNCCYQSLQVRRQFGHLACRICLNGYHWPHFTNKYFWGLYFRNYRYPCHSVLLSTTMHNDIIAFLIQIVIVMVLLQYHCHRGIVIYIGWHLHPFTLLI